MLRKKLGTGVRSGKFNFRAPAVAKVREASKKISNFSDTGPAGRPDEVVADGRMSVRKVVRHPAKGNRYVIRVTGDSMEPRIQSGDLVLVDYAKEPRSGNIVIAIVNGKAVIKKFLRLKGGPVLRSLNPKYPDIVAKEGDEFAIAGVALKVVESNL